MNRIVVNPYAKKSRKRPLSTNSAETSKVIDSNAESEFASMQEQQQQQPQSPRPQQHKQQPQHKQQKQQQVSEDASALVISASDKAGMDGIDRSKIDAIILKESGNSLYIQQQRRRDAKVNDRIQQLQNKLNACQNPKEYAPSPEIESKLQMYQGQQSNRSTKVVVDMDMFYMACELLSKPHLDKVPACVGGGMILTSNYKARRYGVRSAMAGFVADKLVEELSHGQERLVHVKSNFSLYKEKSKEVISVLQEYDPNLKSYSLDEAYLNIGPYLSLYIQKRSSIHNPNDLHQSIRTSLQGKKTIHDAREETTNGVVKGGSEQRTTNPTDGEESYTSVVDEAILQSFSIETCHAAADEVVQMMRAAVTTRTGGLTCSAGIAPNFGLAKIASDLNKPNGQLYVDPHKVLAFIQPLPVRKIPGIGRVTQKILKNVCQVTTVHDLYQQRGLVQWLFQRATADYLLRACVGCIGSGSVDSADADEEAEGQKGISRERTFGPEQDYAKLQERLKEIAAMLSNDMAKKRVAAHTVTVKVKLKTFDVFSKAKSLDRDVYIHSSEDLSTAAIELLTNIKSTSCAIGLGIAGLAGMMGWSMLRAQKSANRK